MTELHGDLQSILEAVEIESTSRYSVLGVECEVRDSAQGVGAADDGAQELVDRLAKDLYDRLYIQPSPPRANRASELSRREFISALSAANNGRGAWGSGWTIGLVEKDSRIAVAKDNLAFWVAPSEVRGENGTLTAGHRCRVWLPKERRGLIPGFYFAIGDAQDDLEKTERCGRLYWHLTHDGAVPFIAVVTSLLNESGVPFGVKVLNDPNAYYRADAGVIYFSRRDDARIGPVIERIYSAVAAFLCAPVPRFAKRIHDGLGVAESPTADGSFGEHRCRLVAKALFDAFRRGDFDNSARAASIASAFQREGLNPLFPHLAPFARCSLHRATPITDGAATGSRRNGPIKVLHDTAVNCVVQDIAARSSNRGWQGTVPHRILERRWPIVQLDWAYRY